MSVDPSMARWEQLVFEKRADELDAEVDDPGEHRFHWRRIPGTTALALTNLLSAGILRTPQFFESGDVHTIARAIVPTWVWGLVFLLSGLALMVAVFTRRWLWLNIGSALSLFVWTAVCSAALASWITGQVNLSPVAAGLFFWMLGGQAAMLITPLVATHGRQPA